MGPSLSLEYYDRIFGVRSASYLELLEAMAHELENYATALGPLLARPDPEALAQLRHSYRPLVENLRLSGLRTLEDDIQEAVADGSPQAVLAALGTRFAQEALALADILTSERLRAGPEPRPPAPGD